MSDTRRPIPFLTDALVFPPAETAGGEGLVAAGGDLRPDRLRLAYRSGIFPWFNEDALILWWSPDPRMVLFPGELRVSKSMRRLLNSGVFQVTKNRDFEAVIRACAAVPRPGQEGTWITEGMIAAYLELHRSGDAVSYEVWENDRLVGGLYGVDLGHVFCGESMFAHVSNASKAGFIHMVQDVEAAGYAMVDCQVYTPHLESLGAREIPRSEFLQILRQGAVS
ncbi:leucyl/phenylalanyl-tRNA--protein transferase [Robiginitalea sp. M366]|uniref:leucyl/phenylalanyl-tRNA--protein transferase n=1 Tax=Robiginitalea aestuariiviva TaxID=3036903 RepID=UPI00240CFB8A|nr:leucyl/phenylalanyl-tRNA--protein transferase [Robiginitalea aestuariiviva]MDG1571740.1 leucyl/phenylalanyl-tRNA--protein transferase [Robiginitalea aestuariiviva]